MEAHIDPLTEAVSRNDLNRASRLLDHGAQPNGMSGSSEVTPLLAACVSGNLEMVKLLLERGADPNLSGKGGDCPLSTAIMSEQPCLEIVQALLVAGANPNGGESDYATPIQTAAAADEMTEVLAALISAGADVNLTRTCKMPAVSRAISMGESEYVYVLLMAGADPEQESDTGQTPLEIAIVTSSPDAVRLLLRFGAMPELKGREPGYAVDFARKIAMRLCDVIEILQARRMNQ